MNIRQREYVSPLHKGLLKTKMTRLILASMFLVFTGVVTASDIAREKRLADQIVDAIFVGEPVSLMAGSHEFLGIYTETEQDKPRGGVILLHGRGYHPDWEVLIHPLRTGLPEAGWHSLSLQMPVLDKQAKYYAYVPIFPEAFPRIEAGIRFLRDKGIKHITLIAHSCSVHMSMAWLEQTRKPDIDAYIGIGMGATDYGQPMEHPFPLQQFAFPILDIYGAGEYSAVLLASADRLNRISQAGNPLSRQVVIPDADHYFHGASAPLTDIVSSWLDLISP